jgi:Clp amino terminal domain, pathogenicity island component
MFERYTEKARRVIFFGRYEASQFGSPYIESEHILLGVLREDKLLTQRFLPLGATETVRVEIQGHTTVRGKTSTSVDLPISDECKRVFRLRRRRGGAAESKAHWYRASLARAAEGREMFCGKAADGSRCPTSVGSRRTNP